MDVPRQLVATAGAEIEFSGLFKMGTRRTITMVAEYYSKSSDFPGCASTEPANHYAPFGPPRKSRSAALFKLTHYPSLPWNTQAYVDSGR
jgi:hypothetical protein